jgi:hypothetical protein
MRIRTVILSGMALAALVTGLQARQQAFPVRSAAARPAGVGPVQSSAFHTVYVRLGSEADEGLLYEPTPPGPRAGIALLFSHPDGNTFGYIIGPQMARRGYRILMVNHHGPEVGPWVYASGISRGIDYLRSLPGVKRVVVVGHSGGAHLMAFYEDVAEHGPSACDGAQKLYPCPAAGLSNLARPDGIILLDPPLGAFHAMSGVDPAVKGNARIAALDAFSAANGFNALTGSGNYSVAFAERFYAAQGARNARIVDRALARLHAIEEGKGQFKDDEPFIVPGMGVNAAGARLYQTDPSAFLAYTKRPHLLLEPHGRTAEVIVRSVRPPMGAFARDLGTLDVMTQDTTVRRFLANYAIRTTPRYAIAVDRIKGVDWDSAVTSVPANARGITVPALVMVMTCHYFVVPGEIIYDHLASKDKTYAAVEGATHMFRPCRPQYGNTVKRTFDYVNAWLSKPGRF